MISPSPHEPPLHASSSPIPRIQCGLFPFLGILLPKIFHPHFVIRILSSAFSIRILSSAFFPSALYIIRIFLSAIRRHPVRTLQRPRKMFRVIQSNPVNSNSVNSKSSISNEDRIPSDLPLCFKLFTISYFELGYFVIPELIVLSLHLKSTPLFRTCQKQSTRKNSQATNKE